MTSNWNKRDDKFEMLDLLSKRGTMTRYELSERLGRNAKEMESTLVELETQRTITIERNASDFNLDRISIAGQIKKKSFEEL